MGLIKVFLGGILLALLKGVFATDYTDYTDFFS